MGAHCRCFHPHLTGSKKGGKAEGHLGGESVHGRHRVVRPQAVKEQGSQHYAELVLLLSPVSYPGYTPLGQAMLAPGVAAGSSHHLHSELCQTIR